MEPKVIPQQLELLNFGKKYTEQQLKIDESAVKSILKSLAVLGASEKLMNDIMNRIAGELGDDRIGVYAD